MQKAEQKFNVKMNKLCPSLVAILAAPAQQNQLNFSGRY